MSEFVLATIPYTQVKLGNATNHKLTFFNVKELGTFLKASLIFMAPQGTSSIIGRDHSSHEEYG